MKFIIATVALVAVVSVGLVDSKSVFGRSKLYDANGHSQEFRKQLGRFSHGKLGNLYKFYAKSVIAPNHPERELDDYRNYLPSGQECMSYLSSYRIHQYDISDLHELILLDACLGYLYDSEHHEEDKKESTLVAGSLEEFQNDATLKAIYYSTKFELFDEEAKMCVGDLLMDWILVRDQYKDVTCNNYMIGLLNNFAKCQKFGVEERHNDLYLQLIFNEVKKQGKNCFDLEIVHTQDALREAYVKNFFSDRVTQTVMGLFKSQLGQAKEYIWTSPVVKVLATISDAQGKLNSRHVFNILTGVHDEMPEWKELFIKNLKAFADRTIKPNEKKSTNKHKQDPNGMNRYAEAVDKVCNYFRASDDAKKYDFVTPFKQMVKMLEHEDIFGISKEYFTHNVIGKSREAAMAYAGVTGCQMMAYTEGAIRPEAQTNIYEYTVAFKPDISSMVRWPQLEYF